MISRGQIGLIITVILRTRAAPHRNAVRIRTVVDTPVIVSTVSYRCLVACTLHVFQPDRSAALSIRHSNHRSSVPETSKVGLGDVVPSSVKRGICPIAACY